MPRKKIIPSCNFIRGQLYSTDALLSIVIFLFALTLISGLTQQLQSQASSDKENYFLTQRAIRAAQTIFSSPGDPIFWESLTDRNTIKSVGVSNTPGNISYSKWLAFRDWNGDDYPSLARALGIGDLNFYITISDSNKTILTQAGTAPVDKNQISVVTLPVVYQSQAVIAAVQVYGG